MATRKKVKSKTAKPKSKARKKAASSKVAKRPRRVAKKKTVRKRTAKAKASVRKKTRKRSERPGAEPFSAAGRGPRSGGQSGDLQGLSRRPAADSESVDELIEEGNAFEADVVAGVEEADNADEQEVHTHEVPEDDVPEEYLDKE